MTRLTKRLWRIFRITQAVIPPWMALTRATIYAYHKAWKMS